MNVKLLTEHHLEFLSLKGGCRGSSESTPVKMHHCWKSYGTAQISIVPSKTRDLQVLLYIKVILIDKEMAMNLTNQDFTKSVM